MIRSPAGYGGGDRIKRYLDYYQPSYGVMMLSAGQAFTPASLFASGEIGAWYDPSDLTTMFQDSAGTTPVTAVGQAVGLILDKSGNGNHASQTTPTAKPLYQSSGGLSWLDFDGTDDFLVTGTINPGSVDKAQIFAGVRKLSDAAVGIIAEYSAEAGSFFQGTFVLHNQTSPVGYRFAAGSGSNGIAFGLDDASVFTAPITNLLTCLSDFAGATLSDELSVRVNSLLPTQTRTGTVSPGTYGNHALYIGRRGGTTLPFNGNVYSLIVRFSAANLSASVISQAETWVAAKTGVTL